MTAIGAVVLVSRLVGDALYKADVASAVLGADNDRSSRDSAGRPGHDFLCRRAELRRTRRCYARPGERIRIILRNTDIGMSHDFVIRLLERRHAPPQRQGTGQRRVHGSDDPWVSCLQLLAPRRDDGWNDHRRLEFFSRRAGTAPDLLFPCDSDPVRRLPMRARLGSAFDSPDTKSRYVRRLFSTIADRYDLITILLSYGQDRRWKRRLVSMAPIQPRVRVLDLACGTGDITYAMQDAGACSVGPRHHGAHGRDRARQAS